MQPYLAPAAPTPPSAPRKTLWSADLEKLFLDNSIDKFTIPCTAEELEQLEKEVIDRGYGGEWEKVRITWMDDTLIVRYSSLPSQVLGIALAASFESWSTENPGTKLIFGGAADVRSFGGQAKVRFSPDGSLYDLSGTVRARPPTIVAESTFSKTIAHVRDKAAKYLMMCGVKLVIIMTFKFEVAMSDLCTRQQVSHIGVEMWRVTSVKQDTVATELNKVVANQTGKDNFGPTSYFKWFNEGKLMRLKAGLTERYELFPNTHQGPIPILHTDAFEDSVDPTPLFDLVPDKLLHSTEMLLMLYLDQRNPAIERPPIVFRVKRKLVRTAETAETAETQRVAD